MIRSLVALFVLSSLVAAQNAYGNKWRDQAVGNWSFVWVEETGRKKETTRGHQRYWKLADGTFRWTNTFRSSGSGTYKTEGWEFPDGKIKLIDYWNGRVYGTGRGTYRLKGKRMTHQVRFVSSDGRTVWSGYTDFSSRNRSVTKMTLSPGRTKVIVTYTRVSKGK